ncbi:unnamed protein product [Paramecium octaurelia]|uniref:Uncharacterized protein n=1 Tax=Paramecium octaurelia TaxID=43137 RepID=A0A8S1TPA8_PAROT|nr:unnamed protein product [Paramecium octaurelia]
MKISLIHCQMPQSMPKPYVIFIFIQTKIKCHKTNKQVKQSFLQVILIYNLTFLWVECLFDYKHDQTYQYCNHSCPYIPCM